MEQIGRLRAAAIDDRLHNIYHRQVELERLCKALISQVSDIQNAIFQDYRYSDEEIKVEYSLAIEAVKRDYASLQPGLAHEEEYLVANGKDAPSKRVPHGLVYIEPCNHNLFYSVVAPLSAALAAGNCVILLLENNLRAVSSLLRRLMPTALDTETFTIVPVPITDPEILQQCIIVDQRRTMARSESPPLDLVSSPLRRAIAVVDRTANIAVAAREIVTARLAFDSESPYAPDVILVNEFVKPKLLQAILDECAKHWDKTDRNGLAPNTGAGAGHVSKANAHVENQEGRCPGSKIVHRDHHFAVVSRPSGPVFCFIEKIEAPVFNFCPVRSLDDAIDSLNKHRKAQPWVAAYLFSNPASAKYLSQFIDASVSFVNHIPEDLLVGPAHPINHDIDPRRRYPPELFSKQRPVFVKPIPQSTAVTKALLPADKKEAESLYEEAIRPLAVMRRHAGGGVGFFEQGFLMSASLLLLSTASLTAAGAWYAWKWTRSGR